MRTLIHTGCVSLLMLGVLCGTAAANTRTGNQNPDLVVTASIGPNHLDVGERGIWAVTVTNTTSQTMRIRVDVEVTAPTFDEGEEVLGSLGPGQSVTTQHTFRARAGGKYKVTVHARDRNGTSHTHAFAVA